MASFKTQSRSGDFHLVGRGRISGTWCESFWQLHSDGTIGPYRRLPTPAERDEILRDIERHRASLRAELRQLELARQVLNG